MPSLYVANLPYTATEEDVRTFFSENVKQRRHGRVSGVRFINEKDTGRPRGFAFVELESDGDVEPSIEDLDGRQLGGRTIKVAKANEKGRGGSGGGGGRRDQPSRDSRGRGREVGNARARDRSW